MSAERILLLKFFGILKFGKIREFLEFLKFVKFEFSIYGQYRYYCYCYYQRRAELLTLVEVTAATLLHVVDVTGLVADGKTVTLTPATNTV